jgi:hypothetical protein
VGSTIPDSVGAAEGPWQLLAASTNALASSSGRRRRAQRLLSEAQQLAAAQASLIELLTRSTDELASAPDSAPSAMAAPALAAPRPPQRLMQEARPPQELMQLAAAQASFLELLTQATDELASAPDTAPSAMESPAAAAHADAPAQARRRLTHLHPHWNPDAAAETSFWEFLEAPNLLAQMPAAEAPAPIAASFGKYAQASAPFPAQGRGLLQVRHFARLGTLFFWSRQPYLYLP